MESTLGLIYIKFISSLTFYVFLATQTNYVNMHFLTKIGQLVQSVVVNTVNSIYIYTKFFNKSEQTKLENIKLY